MLWPRSVLYTKERNRKLKIALYLSQREIHTIASRAAPGDLGLKSHPKDYQKLTYHYGHPSKYKPRPMLLNPSILGGWPKWYANGMPIATDSRRKSSAKRHQFKVSSEGLSTETDILIRSPIQVLTKANVA